jgi:hypothetical protein
MDTDQGGIKNGERLYANCANGTRIWGEETKRDEDGGWKMEDGSTKVETLWKEQERGGTTEYTKDPKTGNAERGTLNLELRTLNLEQRNAGNIQHSTETGP